MFNLKKVGSIDVRIFSPETIYNIFVVDSPETAATLVQKLFGIKTVTNEPDKNNKQTTQKENEISREIHETD